MEVESISKKKIITRIEEIILENFMSYEYARIPLKSGLNIICGPNGSGKSTILIAISVVLGQTYTERSRKLSDLIRHGKDVARATLVFDNKMKDGKRPISFCKSDTFMLSRYLRKDGSYWYEADYREIDKSRVIRLFNDLGINPENVLIIMHQNMVEEFSIISSEDKLKLVEEAVGFQDYRKRILDAERRLESLISEEETVLKALESAQQTLNYWKEIYEKSLLKAELIAKKSVLRREVIWAQIIKQERILESLKEKLENKERRLKELTSRIEDTKNLIEKSYEKLTLWQLEQRKLFYSLLDLEKTVTEIQVIKKITSEIQSNPESLSIQRINISNESITEIEDKISKTQVKLGKNEVELIPNLERYVNYKVNEAILNFRKKNIENEIENIKKEIHLDQIKLSELSPLKEKAGVRIETERYISDIEADLKIVDVQIQSLGNIPDEAEDVYNNYLKTYNELKNRSEIVSQNRKKTLAELEERKILWRNLLQKLIDEVNPSYQNVLKKIGAMGYVRLIDLEDLETAGLELTVGFRGSAPSILNAYTQSGGERTVSIMAFLLSLQQHIKSPLRAVDEFDVHMDPRNREMIFKAIVSTVREQEGIQYLMITPSQLTVTEEGIHIIVVQSVLGESKVKV